MTKQTKRNKTKSRKTRLRRKSIKKGGASFNQSMDFAKIQPGPSSTYNLNSYGGDPSRGPIQVDSRLFLGGGRRKKRVRKMKGGGLFSNPFTNDALLGPNSNSNAVFSAGSTSGASWISNQLAGVGNAGGPMTTYNQNGPTPALV